MNKIEREYSDKYGIVKVHKNKLILDRPTKKMESHYLKLRKFDG